MAIVPKDRHHGSAPTPPTSVVSRPAGSFTGLSEELSNLLELETVPISSQPSRSSEIVSSRKLLKATDENQQHLPGQPRIVLNMAHNDQGEVLKYLKESHLTEELDKLLPYMKYIFVGSPKSY